MDCLNVLFAISDLTPQLKWNEQEIIKAGNDLVAYHGFYQPDVQHPNKGIY